MIYKLTKTVGCVWLFKAFRLDSGRALRGLAGFRAQVLLHKTISSFTMWPPAEELPEIPSFYVPVATVLTSSRAPAVNLPLSPQSSGTFQGLYFWPLGQDSAGAWGTWGSRVLGLWGEGFEG